MLERFLACYGRRRSASTFFQHKKKAFKKLVYTPNAHTAVGSILVDGKSFTAILKDIQVQFCK
jgi:ribosomal protein L25 (general stress protein Ctc)